MNEPLVCWIFLFVAVLWGFLTSTEEAQSTMKRIFRCLTPLVQWYNVTFLLLFLFFLRTFYDIFKFEYMHYEFLSFDRYRDNLNPAVSNIPLSPAELDFQTGPLVIPGWIRVISLLSPVAGLCAFLYSAFQVYSRIKNHTDEFDSARGRFLQMVVLGMPLLFIVMAMRATIRQWAVMTGSCWLPFKHVELTPQERQETWTYLKAAEISTYTQDLEVASGFQFFAVWCFGQMCSEALKNTGLLAVHDRYHRDSNILLQLGILGLNAFVLLGVLKTIFNMIIAVLSINETWAGKLEPVQEIFMKNIDPIFLFATILSVFNMFKLGKMDGVANHLPRINTKFNATRALLVIGQGQLTVLRAATTDGDTHTSKILKMVHKVPFAPFHDLKWWFNMNQCRLLHASLLCFECLIVVYFNSKAWARPAQTNSGKQDARTQPLLPG